MSEKGGVSEVRLRSGSGRVGAESRDPMGSSRAGHPQAPAVFSVL